ncbi:uncharacterized protein V1510DRAFT_431231 [Dipodascopsis tothii]|uniref:uncharacterized protein n=1 Tax=Dipodascopsis tothii TaxID=44089 RepID=UPI0034CD0D4C
MFGTPAPQRPSLFGTPAATPATGAAGGFSFGGGTAAATPATGGFSFGGGAAPAAGGSNAFGTPNTTAAKPLFGSTAAATPAGSGFSFGGATTTAATSAPAFGGFGATATPAATSAPAFGGFGATAAPTSTPAFGGFGAKPAATAAPAFGGFGATAAATPTTSAPAFGGFGAAATPAATSAPAFGGFGATATPAATSAPSFGGFGATPAASTPAFGGFGAKPAATAAPLFGGAAATTSAPAFGGFGAAPAATTASFGGFGATAAAKPAFGTGAAGGFGVGAAQPAQMPALTALTRHSDLPEAAQKELDEIDKYITTQTGISDSLALTATAANTGATDATGGINSGRREFLGSVPRDVEVIARKLATTNTALQHDLQAMQEQKTIIDNAMRDANICFQLLQQQQQQQQLQQQNPQQTPYRSATGASLVSQDQLLEYFDRQANDQEGKIANYTDVLAEIERAVEGIERAVFEGGPTDNAAGVLRALREEHGVFMALGNRVAELHHQVGRLESREAR